MAGLWTPAVNHYSRLDGGRFLSYVHAFLILVGAMLIVQSAHAQEAEPDRSEERIKRALQNPQPIVFNTTLPPLVDTPDLKRIGIFTLEPPQANGQIIQIGVPIGALIMQAVNGIATAHHRRVERKAHEEVMRALADFEAQRPQHSE